MKLTTAAVIVLSALSSLRMKSDTNAFKRRIEPNIISNAYTLFFIYLSLFLISGTVISAIEQIPVISGLFECASAIGTVGLTVGITPQLCSLSKGILIFLMYLGRVGSLTLAYALVSANRKDNSRLPAEKLTVG
jgi:trk system potassium uptake protein TrkH